MKILLIYFMNAFLVVNVFLMYKQLAAQTNLKKFHLFSTQKKLVMEVDDEHKKYDKS